MCVVLIFDFLCFYQMNLSYIIGFGSPGPAVSWPGFLYSSTRGLVRRVPKFFLAKQQLLLLNTVFSVLLMTAPLHPLSNGSNSINKIAGFPYYHIPIGTQYSIHLQEHKLHITSAQSMINCKKHIYLLTLSSEHPIFLNIIHPKI